MTRLTKRKLSIVVSVVSLMLMTAESAFILTSGPDILIQYGLSPEFISWINLGYYASAIISLLLGVLADKQGMKKLMFVGNLLFTIGCLIVVFGNITYFIVGRTIIGVAYYGLLSSRVLYLSHLIDDSKSGKLNGFLKLMTAFVSIAVPAISVYFMQSYNYRLFYFILFILSIMITFTYFFVSSVEIVRHSPEIKEESSKGERKKRIWLYLASFMFSIPSVFMITYYGIILRNNGYSAETISISYQLISVGTLIAGILVILGSDRMGVGKWVKTSIFASAVFAFLMAYFGLELKLMLVFMLFYDMAWSLYYLVVGSMVADNKIQFMTILGMINGLSNIVTSISAPIIFRGLSGESLYWIGGGALLFTYLVFFIMSKEIKNEQKF